MKKAAVNIQTFFVQKSSIHTHARHKKIQYLIASLLIGTNITHADIGAQPPQSLVIAAPAIPGVVSIPPVSPALAVSSVSSSTPAAAALSPATQPSLEPSVADLPATYTFRSSCITKSYKDAVYGDLIEPTLVKNADGTYTLHVSCRNGVGVPTIDSTLVLTLTVRNINNNGTNVRTISVRSKIGDKLRNCADISNVNGSIICTPAIKK
ncbi:MAG: hypothetical protein V4544_06585 [Pseudomonadota bacterium]